MDNLAIFSDLGPSVIWRIMADKSSEVSTTKERESAKEREEKKEAMTGGPSMIHRSGSRPQLDLSGAAIHGNFEDRYPTILLPNQSDDISHLALDIGGTYLLFHHFMLPY